MEKANINNLKVSELKQMLRDLGAPISGTKVELITRLNLWKENGLARKLVHPVEVTVSQPANFPVDLEPIEYCNVSCFKTFSLSSIDFWFSERQARGSMNKGRKLFLSKFVKCCSASVKDKQLFLKCFCAAETSKSVDYVVQVMIDDTGEIRQCSCSCTAGEGFSAACKHTSALLYCYEHYIGSNILHQLVAKTSQLQSWHRPPAGRKVEPKTAGQLASKNLKIPVNVKMQYYPTISDVINIALNAKSQSLLVNEARKPANPSMYFEHDYTKNNLSIQRINDLNFLSDKETKSLERKTRKQASTKLWWKARQTRITGSNTWSVVSTVKTGKLSKVPARAALCPKNFSSKATKWGKQNEGKAIKAYELLTGSQVSPSGLHVHPNHQFLASSPDGITTDGKVVVEVKCPYSLKDEDPTRAKYFTCNNGVNSLKRNHAYYYQIQNHMFCTGIEKCDFVVWTSKGVFIEMIPFDEIFVAKMFDALKYYYENVFCEEAVKFLQFK